MCIMVEMTSKWTVWLPLHIFYIWCMTILGVPGWAPTDDTQPEPWAKACLGCNPSHQVWIVRTSGKGNTLSYQRVFPLDPYVHTLAGVVMCNDTSRRKGWIGIITSSHCALFEDRVGYLYTSCHVWHLFLILSSVTSQRRIELSATCRVSSLGACRLYF